MNSYQQMFHYGSLFWALLSMLLLCWAWYAIRHHQVQYHKRLMLLLSAMAWLFMLSYLLRYSFPELNRPVPREHILWFALHGTVALVPLLGASCLLFARMRLATAHHLNRQHKRYGLLILATWFFTHMGGVYNLWLLG